LKPINFQLFKKLSFSHDIIFELSSNTSLSSCCLEAKKKGKKNKQNRIYFYIQSNLAFFRSMQTHKRKLKILILTAQVEIKVILHDMLTGTHYDYNKQAHSKEIYGCSNINNINMHSKHIRPWRTIHKWNFEASHCF
jgi:hypothetical protein